MNTKVKKIAYSAMFAAIIFVLTMIHVPMGAGGYVHIGDAAIYIAGACLGGPYALLSAAIGAAIADLVSGFPMYAIFSVVIKVLVALPFVLTRKKSKKILTLTTGLLTIASGIITVLGYYIADLFLYREGAIADVPGNLIQAVGSAVVFIVFAFALDKMKLKTKVFAFEKDK